MKKNGIVRLCVVEGRGPFKRGATFCPILEEEKSGVECVLGADQLDCLRRISKGTVDFGVFSPEDLIAAQWADIDVLVTNEIRQRHRPYERRIVSVVNRRILFESEASLSNVLRNSTLCHPGVGVDDLRPLSDTLAGYLESLIIPRSCEPELTLTENHIKAVSSFFYKACKAGPWVPDKERDAALKKKYPNLCGACASAECSTNDKYFGPLGALQCLGDDAGDALWGEMDDVMYFFGVNSSSAANSAANIDSFSYLCRDGSSQPVAGNLEPCVWLNRPWPVVIAKRKASASVSSLVSSLQEEDLFRSNWRGALASLLEVRQAPVTAHMKAPLDYLASAKGFREAYSQSGCDPPRHITMCTNSLLEKNKCEWLSEAGAVYGVKPPLQCVMTPGAADCLRSVRDGASDVTVQDSDWLPVGSRIFDLKPVLYEVTPIVEKMDTVMAYVRSDASINNMADLRGKRAAFPSYDGVAWHSVFKYIADKEKYSCHDAVQDYFSEICAPGVEISGFEVDITDKYTRNCYKEEDTVIRGEVAALRSIVEGKSDVAFISMKTVKMYQSNLINEPWSNKKVDLKQVCPDENKKYCYISWSNIGHIYAKKNITAMRKHEIITMFTKLDQLFGKHQPFHNVMFTMYGPYNHQIDVIFHNNTKSLSTEHLFKTHPYDSMPFNFETSYDDSCQTVISSTAYKLAPTVVLLAAILCILVVN
ncbi:unnamed protein product [Danaus chrysippus]|uniref:(African queen) hypothetical protein n=1 Tax=Danaus chrysippus TaxID=151541 RepID=A0A8J2W7B0_9NEOP|nr:unnamed protein product [Danaus chrysippus]